MGSTGERPSETHHVYSNVFYLVTGCFIKELDRRFSNDSGAILSDISALSPDAKDFYQKKT